MCQMVKYGGKQNFLQKTIDYLQKNKLLSLRFEQEELKSIVKKNLGIFNIKKKGL